QAEDGIRDLTVTGVQTCALPIYLADQLLAHVEPADEMRGHADVVQTLEQIFRNTIVDDALALNHLVLLRVGSRGGVVFEMLNQSARFRALIEDLRLAFIDAASAAHRSVPWFVKVHRECRGSSVGSRSAAAK